MTNLISFDGVPESTHTNSQKLIVKYTVTE